MKNTLKITITTLFITTLVLGNNNTLFETQTDTNLVINEIMQNPDAVNDTDGEWFEVFNTGNYTVNLHNWIIKDNGSDTHTIASSLSIAPNDFIILGINSTASTNGGIEVDYQYADFSLSNGSDEVILADPNGVVFDSVAYDNGTTFPDLSGVSMALLDPSLDNTDGSNWVASTLSYGDGDLGTPGLPNFMGDISLSLVSLNFDTVTVGSSLILSVFVVNNGNDTLNVESVYTSNSDFSSSLSAFSVPTNDSTELNVTFTPSVYGHFLDTLFIRSNDPVDSTVFAFLNGVGYQPVPHIAIDSASINFGATMIGATNEKEIYIFNTGEDILVVDSIYTDSTEFFTSISEVSIAVGDSAVCVITFSPLVIRSYNDTLYLVSNDPDNDTLKSSLSAEGIEPDPNIALLGEDIDFGTVARGDTASISFSIYNIGMEDLEIEEITISDTAPFWTDFSDATLEPGDSVSVIVYCSFQWTHLNSYSADLVISSNDPDQSFYVLQLNAATTGRTLHVPGSYPTIQTAIDTAFEDDTVLVAPGTYVLEEEYGINFGTKNLVVMSSTGPDSTIIDCDQNPRALTMGGEQDSTTVFQGFTITNANNDIAQYYHGIIHLFNVSPILSELIVPNNTVGNSGLITIVGYDNGVGTSDWSQVLQPQLHNVTFSNNSGERHIYPYESNQYVQVSVINSIFDGSDFGFNGGELTVSYSNLYNVTIDEGFTVDGGGNINSDPLFCDYVSLDYSLAENSPCVGTGENGTNMGALGVGCETSNEGGIIHVSSSGSDSAGTGSEANPFSSIGIGIERAVVGDTVLVSPGIYTESIEMDVDSILVASYLLLYPDSLDLVENTVISVSPDTVDSISVTMGYSSTIYGFTINSGAGNTGIVVTEEGTNIENCRVINNEVGIEFAGDYNDGFSQLAIVSYSEITGNESGFIISNDYGNWIPVLDHCTITNNGVGVGSGFSSYYFELHSSIVWEDSIQSEIYSIYSNINEFDPLFCNPDSGDYTLDGSSLCLGTGENGTNMGAYGFGCGEELSSEDEFIPTTFALLQNYPNPFNPITTIQYNVPVVGAIHELPLQLWIYDITGQLVATLVDRPHAPGRYSVKWNAAGMASGMYFYRINAGEFTATKKLVLLK